MQHNQEESLGSFAFTSFTHTLDVIVLCLVCTTIGLVIALHLTDVYTGRNADNFDNDNESPWVSLLFSIMASTAVAITVAILVNHKYIGVVVGVVLVTTSMFTFVRILNPDYAKDRIRSTGIPVRYDASMAAIIAMGITMTLVATKAESSWTHVAYALVTVMSCTSVSGIVFALSASKRYIVCYIVLAAMCSASFALHQLV